MKIEEIREQALVERMRANNYELGKIMSELDRAEILLVKTQQEANQRLRHFVNRPLNESSNGSRQIYRLRALVSKIEDVIVNLKEYITRKQQTIKEVKKDIDELTKKHSKSRKKIEKFKKLSHSFIDDITLQNDLSSWN